MDGGVEKIEDPALLAATRREARRLWWSAVAIGTAGTLAVLALPA